MTESSPLHTLLGTRHAYMENAHISLPPISGDLEVWWDNAKPFAYGIESMLIGQAFEYIIESSGKIEPFSAYRRRSFLQFGSRKISVEDVRYSSAWQEMDTYFKSICNRAIGDVIDESMRRHLRHPTEQTAMVAWLSDVMKHVPRNDHMSLGQVMQRGVSTGVRIPLSLFGDIPFHFWQTFGTLPNSNQFQTIAHRSIPALTRIAALDLEVFNEMALPDDPHNAKDLWVSEVDGRLIQLSENREYIADVSRRIPEFDRSPEPHGCPSLYDGVMKKTAVWMLETAVIPAYESILPNILL